jgi:hypothetical protein
MNVERSSQAGRLISLELDGDGLAVEFLLEGKANYRVEQRVTSQEAKRLQSFVVHELLPSMTTFPVDMELQAIEPNDETEQYDDDSDEDPDD